MSEKLHIIALEGVEDENFGINLRRLPEVRMFLSERGEHSSIKIRMFVHLPEGELPSWIKMNIDPYSGKFSSGDVYSLGDVGVGLFPFFLS